MVGGLRHNNGLPRAECPFATASAAHGQLLFAVDALDPFSVDEVPLTPQQNMQPPVTEAPSFLRQRLPPLAKNRITGTRGLIAHAGPVHVDRSARPPLAHPVDDHTEQLGLTKMRPWGKGEPANQPICATEPHPNR